MTKSVYLESSVISYLTSRPSRDLVIAGHQASTSEWWNEARSDYEAFISPLVIEEISAGDKFAAEARLQAIADIPILEIKPEAEELAALLLSSNAVPANSDRDALHIAIAATQGVDYLLTWNFKHINNASTRALVVNTVSSFGLVCPVLCSPEELIGEENA
ncbi:MAG: PIN domain-containing protein [Verrucomicrobiae bacterium]|nr:PIN domain-containing protein [Verrucomicrobiae bacterium]